MLVGLGKGDFGIGHPLSAVWRRLSWIVLIGIEETVLPGQNSPVSNQIWVGVQPDGATAARTTGSACPHIAGGTPPTQVTVGEPGDAELLAAARGTVGPGVLEPSGPAHPSTVTANRTATKDPRIGKEIPNASILVRTVTPRRPGLRSKGSHPGP